jgi:hypothetical protein
VIVTGPGQRKGDPAVKYCLDLDRELTQAVPVGAKP